MKYGESISEFIRKYRQETGYSQGELAKLLGFKSGQYISNVERKINLLPVPLLKRLHKRLDIKRRGHLEVLMAEAAFKKLRIK